jgi:hypothetical protein
MYTTSVVSFHCVVLAKTATYRSPAPRTPFQLTTGQQVLNVNVAEDAR